MRCHYEVLGISMDASSDDIKKAYRKEALKWHPDKHTDDKDKEEANKKFLEIQDAYETLSNDQERAWYDSHREVLINGGTPGDPSESNYLFNIYPYFTSSCFKGFGDDEKGFYTVYREMFNRIIEEDRSYYDEEVNIPDFGSSDSDYDTVVGPFYSFWLGYISPRSFVWCEKHDIREANDRQIRRLMEKENKKFRDKAKKERNEEIRKIVEFVRKKDKRVEQYKKYLEEKSLLAQKKAQERKEADRLRREEQMKNYVAPAWSADIEKQLDQMDLEEERKNKKSSNNANNETNENENLEDEDSEEFDEDLFCVACNKSFKSAKSFQNHEKSKKHKENIELLKEIMVKEDAELFFDKKDDENEDDVNQEETATKQKLSKKQKKKRKQNKQDAKLNEESNSDEKDDDDAKEEKLQDESKEDDQINELNKETVIDKTEIESKNKPTDKEQDKQKKLKEKTTKNEMAEQADSEQSVEKTLKCSVCEEEFDSRNKLFDHIKKMGHAVLKASDDQKPLSHNALKKQKQMAKKSKK